MRSIARQPPQERKRAPRRQLGLWGALIPLAVLAVLGFGGSARAQDPQTVPPASPSTAGPDATSDTSQRALDERGRAVRALIAGELDPAVDAEPLLQLDIDGDLLSAEDLRLIFDAMGDAREARATARRPPRVPVELEPSTTPAEAHSRLRDAYLAFLSESEENRAALLAAHHARQTAASAETGEISRLTNRLARLRQDRAQWEAFLAGTLDVAIDPAPLLRLDLGDPSSIAVSPERLARAAALAETEAAAAEDAGEDPAADADSTATPPPATPAPDVPPTLDALRDRVHRAELALDALRMQYWAMEPAARMQLLDQHAARQAQPDQAGAETEARIDDAQAAADSAAAEREQALEAGRLARSESLRLVAEERARLLGVKQAQAVADGELARGTQQAAANHDDALLWVRRANETMSAVDRGQAPTEDPDALYQALRDELRTARERLAQALRDISSGDTAIPDVGEPPAGMRADVDRSDINQLREEVTARDDELRETETSHHWELADTYRNDIVLLNRARLNLLEATSSGLRSRVTGFGVDGVTQVSRELNQVGLELRYLSLSLPRYSRALLAEAQTAPIPITLTLLQLAAALLVFRWWRGRAERILNDLRKSMRARRQRSLYSRFVAETAWYLRRIRAPLEWLGLVYLCLRLTSAIEVLPELRLLWLVVLWLALGMAVIQFVDALAARDQTRRRAPDPTAALRFRSLRVTGLTVVVVGLVLSLTSTTVGQGAIYSWVIQTCWVLALPIILVLVSWWKPHIFEVIDHEPAGRFTDWVSARTTGWTSFAAAAAGGVYVFFRGIFRWGMRRVATFDATRRIMAYLFRREVARQAEATQQQERLQPLSEERAGPLLLEASSVDDEVATPQLEKLAALVRGPRSTLSAVVGERGMGKTTLLRRLQRRVDTKMLLIPCPVDGFNGLLRALGASLGVGHTLPVIAAALRERGECIVAIDDAQRLVRPTIGGMRSLDDLGKLARLAGGEISWVVAMGSAAWQYVSRARGDRLFFDQTIRLAPWTEDQIGRLIRARTEKSGLEPSFEGLVVPRQYDDADVEDGARSEAGFYRILWDYADGNPSVAALFWSRSLYCNDAGEIVVRLFKAPSAAQLDTLALPIKFVLRALVQLERATPEEIARATRMAPAEVDDALRFAGARGYLDIDNDVIAISWPWYRALTDMLYRQHLLAA